MDGSQGARGADTVVVSATSATQRGAIWAWQTLDEYPVLTTKQERPTKELGAGGRRRRVVYVSSPLVLFGVVKEARMFVQTIRGTTSDRQGFVLGSQW